MQATHAMTTTTTPSAVAATTATATEAAMMAAVVQDRYGDASVLRLADVPRPSPREGEVLVHVHAAGVDPGVWHLMTGLPYVIRLGFGLRRPKSRVPGMNLSGHVVAVGRGVSGFAPGDAVFGTGRGTFAELAVARADRLTKKPAALSHEEAAAVPVSGITALQALRDKARVRPGQRVLVVGAGGGVGTFAVQIGKALGCEVTAVCSAGKAELVRSLGADHVIDYRREDLAARGGAYDAVLDIAGARPLGELRRLLTRRGTLVLIGGEGGGRWLGPLTRNLGALALGPFVSQRLAGMIASEAAADLVALRTMIQEGTVRPVVGASFGLAQAAEALRTLEAGTVAGKIVLSV